MSALAFLRAGGEAAGVGGARSPMADETAAAGARCALRDGWQVALSYPDPEAELRALRDAVAFVDVSHLGALELQGDGDALDGLPELPGAPDGSTMRSQAGRTDGAWWCRLGPERGLVVCDSARTRPLGEELEGTFHGQLLDVSAMYGKLVLAGPLAREALARFCALELRPALVPVGGFRPGSVARTPGAVLREGRERYLVLFGAAYGGYMWRVVADAAGRLGGAPAGVEALARAAPLGEGLDDPLGHGAGGADA